MQFTEAQQAAIQAANPAVLVSAAAGSGKTRVLIEHIVTLIREHGLSIDRMLIVTFTRAAAAEMRERLQDRLTQAAADDRAMRRQAELLETAQISTLHSFCQKLTREYFQTVDIDPQAMLGDETICANLRSLAKSDALDALYERAAAGDAAAKTLTDKFEESQIDAMLSDLYPFLMGLPNPFEWMDENAAKHYTDEDLYSGAMAETLFGDCGILLSGAAELAEQAIVLGEKPLCPDAYLKTMRADRDAVQALSNAQAGGLPAVIAAANAFKLDRLPTVRGLEGEEAALRDAYKKIRDEIKALVKQVAAHLPEDPNTAIRHLNVMQPALAALAETIRELDENFAERKRGRNLIDYHDLERMALRILSVPAIREEVSARFDAVFVDEYQDISSVQEAILNALRRNVSRETNQPLQRYFYVGDVKQSIYRFRQADPTLFMRKAREFSPRADAENRRITLNANFRSRETVLAAVNRVFERTMRADVTEIDYDDEARLYPGNPSAGDPPVTLHVFTQQMKPDDRVRLQAHTVAEEILKRVGRPMTDRKGNPAGILRYRDIAVLSPKMKGVSDVLQRVLGDAGIPVYCEDQGSAMESEEIAQALNHLRLMDNIADDLALLGCLRGPAVGMDDRDLAEIRLRTPDGSYLGAVRSAAAENDALGARCRQALEMLEHERFLLAETPLDEYLWGWLNRSGLYAFYGCQGGGALRQANLRMLCQKAGEHVKRRGGGLHDFLSGVEAKTMERDKASPTVLSPWEDVVRVMTIHKSKGLEFPVVFVMGLEGSFQRRNGSSLALHPRLGVALPYVNEEARTRDDTLLKAAIDLRAGAEERAERARLLYVAMTRAKEELVLLGCGEKLRPEELAHGQPASAYGVFGAQNMLTWIWRCMGPGDRLQTTDAVSDREIWKKAEENLFSTESTSFPRKTPPWTLVFHNDEAESVSADARTDAAARNLDVRAQRLRALAREARECPPPEGDAGRDDPVAPPTRFTHHPFKVGVTALVHAMRQTNTPLLLTTDESDASQQETEDGKRLPLPLNRPKLMDDLPNMPAFLRPPAEQTGLRRGVATHKALSLIDYRPLRVARDDPARMGRLVTEQLDDLTERRLLTAEERNLTDAGSVAGFLLSPCGRQALDAETLRREWSFNLLLPERDGLIVQGIIDLCYLTEGMWSLVDYKTDRVTQADALWALYGEQIALYRRALAEATGIPVRDATLFSLSLGLGSTRIS